MSAAEICAPFLKSCSSSLNEVPKKFRKMKNSIKFALLLLKRLERAHSGVIREVALKAGAKNEVKDVLSLVFCLIYRPSVLLPAPLYEKYLV